MKLSKLLICSLGMLFVFSCSLAAETVNLGWSPCYTVIRVGESANLGLYATSASGGRVKLSAMDVVMAYDQSCLWFRNYSPGGASYQWKVDGFLTPSPDGINLELDDGLMMYTAWAQLGVPAYATKSGLRVTTLRFDGVVPVCRTFVSIPASSGHATTRVFDGVTPNLDIHNQSNQAAIMVVPEDYCVSVAEVRKAADTSEVKLGGPIVTRAFGTYFYMEDANRISGIRVDCSAGDIPAEGTTPRVEGIIRTVNGERRIDATLVTEGCPMEIPGLLAANTNAASVGLSTVGLLTRVSGSVQAVKGGLALNDGSATPLTLDLDGTAAPEVGEFVAATGIVGRDGAACVIHINKAYDIQVLSRN